jgi:hypothetical protein
MSVGLIILWLVINYLFEITKSFIDKLSYNLLIQNTRQTKLFLPLFISIGVNQFKIYID